jgi:hypothetical protein
MPKPPKQPSGPKLPEKKTENVVQEELTKGDVRPDGPGDETAPVEPDKTRKP